jgi:SanA protein
MSKKLFWTISLISIFSLVFIIVANFLIENSTDDQVYNDVNLIPYNKVGLLLGTSKFIKSGLPNQYFVNRIRAAVDLFKANKITYVVISGDHGLKEYNEPLDMKKDLMQNGITEDKIFLDYAGFRTYDSVIRLDKIFGQKSFTIVSQEWHNRRAIYIAQKLDLQAVGYTAQDVDLYNGFKTKLREKLARVKVFIDFLIGKNPKFLGEKIEIK